MDGKHAIPAESRISNEARNYFLIGLAFSFGAFGLPLERPRLESILTELAPLTLALWSVTLWWLGAWLVFGFSEGELLEEYLGMDQRDLGRYRVAPALYPLFIGAMFGLLIAFPPVLNVYLPVAFLTNLASNTADLISLRVIHKELRRHGGDRDKPFPATDCDNLVKEQIRQYYWNPRYHWRGFSCLILLAVALVFQFGRIEIWELDPTGVAYGFTILAVFINELVVWMWRRPRNRAIMVAEGARIDPMGLPEKVWAKLMRMRRTGEAE